MMLLELGALMFVLIGSKLVLGAIAVYLLLPTDSCCATCDAETLPLLHRHGTYHLMRLLRLQRRWCMECQRESLTRRGRQLAGRHSREPIPVAESRVR